MPMFETPQSPSAMPPSGSLPPNLPPPPMPPSPSMTPPPAAPTGPAAPPPAPQVYTMPEKFRAGAGSGSPTGRGSNRKLVIILVSILVLGGLGVAGLYVFQNVFNKTDNTNVAVTNTANQNTNSSTNTANSNENTNTVANENTNSATNDNTNAAVNTNTTNTNTATNTNTSAQPIPSSVDTDADGLTDVEEAVYTTDPNKPDSDADGFIDGKKLRADGQYDGELYNGYNPAGTGRLEDSSIVKRQNNSTNEYSIIIPSAWTAVLDQSGGILVNPSQATTEYFQVRIYENPNSQSAKDWYKGISPETDVNTLKTTQVNGLEGIYSEDNSTVYLMHGTKVYGITYSTGSVNQANYYTTFDVIVRNFRLVSSSS